MRRTMRMMSLAMILAMLLTLTACGGKTEAPATAAPAAPAETQAAAAEHVIDLFRKGQTEIIVLLRNQDASPTAFNQQINQVAERRNLSCGWSTWTFPHGEDTVFRVVFQTEEN